MKNDVVILVIAHKSVLNEFEIISLKQLYKILGHYPIKFICPRGLDVSFYKEIINKPEFDFIDPCWQATYANFNKLKISPLLYKKYQYYKYILFYEPDAYVFRDELSEWCAKGYDYIGAPWFEGWHDATPTSKFIGVGNGGFSLRKNKSMLRLIKVSTFYDKLHRLLKGKKLLRKIVSNQIIEYFRISADNNQNEDYYIFNLSKQFHWFKIASTSDAYKFSFDVNPKELYKLNNNKLPFGCHAWHRYQYDDFWKQFINN